MSYNPAKIVAASFMPGLQNNGTFSVTAEITGLLYASGSDGTTSSLVGNFTIPLPDNTVIANMRIQIPTGSGDLADKWFPLIGTVVLRNNASSSVNYRIILMSSNSPEGRLISYNIVNIVQDAYNFTSSPMQVNIYGHLYTIPW